MPREHRSLSFSSDDDDSEGSPFSSRSSSRSPSPVSRGRSHTSAVGKFLDAIADHESPRYKPSPMIRKPKKQQQERRHYSPSVSKFGVDKGRKAAGQQKIAALKDARKKQKSSEFILRKTGFGRLVRTIAAQHKVDVRFHGDAMTDLQLATEQYMRSMCSNAFLAASHAKRESISAADLWLANNMCISVHGGEALKHDSDEGAVAGITNDDMLDLGASNLRRIATSGTSCNRVSADYYDMARKVITRFLDRVLNDAIIMAEYSRRKTITAEDIKEALKKQGYGFY